MAATVYRITANEAGGILGELAVDTGNQSLATSVGQRTKVLCSTNTVITKPTGATIAVIMPPSGNTVIPVLKGGAGDTGVSLHLTLPSVVPLDSNVSGIVIHANSPYVTLDIAWF